MFRGCFLFLSEGVSFLIVHHEKEEGKKYIKNTYLDPSSPLQGQRELGKVEPTGAAEEWKYEPFYFHGHALFFPVFSATLSPRVSPPPPPLQLRGRSGP